MTIVGIIAEYNPLHNGHLYQLRQASQQADYVVVIISGSFVQRGEPAAYDKWMRSRWALEAGADLVLELPTCYVLQSARAFAQGAVSALAAVGCNVLSFGTESDDKEALREAARLLYDESSLFQKYLKLELKKGKSYPRARHDALLASGCVRDEVAFCLTQPNFLLAAEYLRANQALDAPMDILPIIRKGEPHDAALRPQQSLFPVVDKNSHVASASSIRALVRQDPLNPYLSSVLPDDVHRDIRHYPISDMRDLENTVLYCLRTMDAQALGQIFGADEGLDHLLRKAGQFSTLDEVLAACKSKRYTLARIRRLLCAVLLNLPSSLIEQANRLFHTPPYLRILGFRRESALLLSQIANEQIPLISRKRDMDLLQGIPRQMMELDIRATSLQSLAFPDPKRRVAQRDYSEPIVVWPS